MFVTCWDWGGHLNVAKWLFKELSDRKRRSNCTSWSLTGHIIQKMRDLTRIILHSTC
jgi:hypothetical protein